MPVIFREVLHPRDRRGRFRRKRNLRIEHEDETEGFAELSDLNPSQAQETLDSGRPDLTDAQELGLEAYKVGNYEGINRYLRGQDRAADPLTITNAENLTAALEQGVMPMNFRAYRYMDDQEVKDLFDQGELVGAKITDDGAMSTSLDPGPLDTFKEDIDRPIRLTLEVPAGTHGLYEGGVYTSSFDPFMSQEGPGPGNPDIAEVLLRPGTTYEVTGAEEVAGELWVSGRVVEQYADNPHDKKADEGRQIVEAQIAAPTAPASWDDAYTAALNQRQ